MNPLNGQTRTREALVCSTGPICLRALEIARRYWLSPLAGYTNLAFRLAVRELSGLGMATTDLVNARALLQGGRKSMELVQTCPADRPLAVQIYGAEPEEMIAAAQWLESSGVSAVDINMGCPVHKVVRGGGGSAMMCDAHRAVGLVGPQEFGKIAPAQCDRDEFQPWLSRGSQGRHDPSQADPRDSQPLGGHLG